MKFKLKFLNNENLKIKGEFMIDDDTDNSQH